MSTSTEVEPRAAAQSNGVAYAALAAVCLLWGTTYLGIRIGLESLPPLYLIAIRYTISGGLLVCWAAARSRLPTGRELWQTAICGIVAIGIGNGCLAIAELWVPSGLAALFYSTCPLWMVAVHALLPAGHKPSITTVSGLAIGMAGVVYLVLPAAEKGGLRTGIVLGFLVLQISALGWVSGALLQTRVQTSVPAVITGGVQQLAAGLAMFVPALYFEKLPHKISLRSELAIAYLIVFGSLIGFTAFIYAMKNLPVAIVSIYTFVNPVVAVALGWLFVREPFGIRELISMLIIFCGIAVVRRSEKSAQLAEPEP